MKHINITLLFLLFALVSYTQNLSNDPYSRFGLGDLYHSYTATASGMGSVGVGLTNPLMINHNNPASYSLIYKQRFIMQTGLYHVTNEMKISNSDVEKSQITNFSNLSHFNIAFPIAKWWGGSIGLLPYSTFSYSFSDKHEYPSADLFFKGNGGLNRFYVGHSIKPHKNFSLGVNINYMFGKLSTERRVIFQDQSLLNSKQIENTRVKGFYYDFGALFNNKIGEFNLTISTNIDNGNSISAKKTIFSETFRLNTLGSEITEDDSLSTSISGEIILPKAFSSGFSLYNDKLLFAFDYSLENWTKFKIFDQVDDNLDNSSRIAMGFQYVPDRKAINKYFKMIRYRIGIYSSKTNLNLRDQHLNEQVFSFGFGLPLKRTGALLNLSAELGRRGTTENNLIQDQFARFKFGLILSDIWFIKRKYD